MIVFLLALSLLPVSKQTKKLKEINKQTKNKHTTYILLEISASVSFCLRINEEVNGPTAAFLLIIMS